MTKSTETNDCIKIQKGWGIGVLRGQTRTGEIFVYHKPSEKTEHQMKIDTVKILYLGKHKKLSLHFHSEKEEVFCIAYGKVKIEYILPDGQNNELVLEVGDRIFIPRNIPHRMTGVEDINILIEASTLDKPEDSFRIVKGD